MDVSENSGNHKSSILIGFSIINHPFWGTPIVGNTHYTSIYIYLTPPNFVKFELPPHHRKTDLDLKFDIPRGL